MALSHSAPGAGTGKTSSKHHRAVALTTGAGGTIPIHLHSRTIFSTHAFPEAHFGHVNSIGSAEIALAVQTEPFLHFLVHRIQRFFFRSFVRNFPIVRFRIKVFQKVINSLRSCVVSPISRWMKFSKKKLRSILVEAWLYFLFLLPQAHCQLQFHIDFLRQGVRFSLWSLLSPLPSLTLPYDSLHIVSSDCLWVCRSVMVSILQNQTFTRVSALPFFRVNALLNALPTPSPVQ